MSVLWSTAWAKYLQLGRLGATTAMFWALLHTPVMVWAQTGETGIAWRVTGNNSSGYLFGSLHFATVDMYPLDAQVEQAFEQADVLVVEIDILNVDLTESTRLMVEHGTYVDGSRLQDHLSDDSWRKFSDVLTARGYKPQRFQAQRPWLVAINLTAMELARFGYRDDLGLDLHFLQQRTPSQRLVELESFESQMQVFFDLSGDEEESLLLQTLAELDEGRAFFDNLFDAWKQRRGDELARIMIESNIAANTSEKLFERLFTQRNENMTRQFEQLLNSGDKVFMVVGVGHLVGAGGIVERLRDKGYGLEAL